MKVLLFLAAFAFATVESTFGRFINVLSVTNLIADSAVAVVGEVKAVEPSGITTRLVYPTWEGVVFEWLKTDVEVVEPIKGAKKGDRITVMLLSTRGPSPGINPPGTVDVKKGQLCFFSLLPTTQLGAYAGVTAPFDDCLSVFVFGNGTRRTMRFEQHAEIWTVANDDGTLKRGNVEMIRKKYAKEIGTVPKEDAVIHLEWKKETSPGGWESSVPADEIRLVVGMDKERALSILEDLGAEDITSNLAIRGPNGEQPTKLYWALKDFGENKLQRAKTEKAVRTIRFNLKIKEVIVEAPKL